MTQPLHILWFKRDLRISDHRPLTLASRAGPVLPLLIVEPDYWRQPDASRRQYQFMVQCAQSLDSELSRLGQPLAVRTGRATEVLEDLHRRHGVAGLWSHEETGNGWTFRRDIEVAAWARSRGVPWTEIRQDGVVRRLKNRNGWARRWDRLMAEPETEAPRALEPVAGIATEPLPEAGELGLAPDRCTAPQRGGRAEAEELLESFLFRRGRNYRREMSNPVEGATACSRLSPHLAWGTISMREAAQAAWARMRELRGDRSSEAQAWRASLVSFVGRLHWHCHFMQKLESEPSIEFREFHPAMRDLRPGSADTRLFEAWSRGQTGYPFLDACMRSLEATGWLNFRMRAMVMSFASYNLWLPWRDAGLHLARQFTDYEPGIHWSQVQMQSGTTGINTIRVYNVVKQGYDQDPSGIFVRRWVPELADVPDEFLQEPWRWGGYSTLAGARYPVRIVDLAESASAAKDRIYAARRSRGFGEAADAIQERHGSRKSGLPMTGRKKIARRSNDTQLKLDL